MKKQYLIGICLAFSLFSSQAQAATTYLNLLTATAIYQQGFTIKGYIKGLDKVDIKLTFRKSNHDGREKKEEYLTQVKDGYFEFKGPQLPQAVYCTIGNDDYMLSLQFWLDNSNISVEGDVESSSFKISGSKTEDESKLFHATYDGYVTNIMSSYQKLKEAKQRKESPQVISRLEEEHQQWRKKRLDFGEQFVKDRPGSQISLNYLFNCSAEEGGLYADRLFSYLTSDVQQSSGGKKIKRTIEGIKSNRIGESLPDYIVEDVNGKKVKMSDYRGKFLLLTIGSGLNKTYKESVEFRKTLNLQYQHKGLEQVDLLVGMKDSKEVDQLSGQLGMTWPLLSDYDGMSSEILVVYNVNTFPTSILIDPAGVILARGLSNIELGKLLGEKIK